MKSTLTCPKCGHKQEGEIPTDSCAYYYVCDGYKERIQPIPPDCCVFCSYGDKLCPTSKRNK